MHQEKLSVLVCVDSFFDGGAEMFAIRLANQLCRDYSIIFLELNPDRSLEKHQVKYIDPSIKLVQAGAGSLPNWLYQTSLPFLKPFFWRLAERQKAREIQRLVEDHQIAIVHSHSWASDAWFAAYPSRPFKLICSLHGEYEILLEKYGSPELLAKTWQSFAAMDEVVYLSAQHNKTLDQFQVPTIKRHRIFHGIEYPLATTITRYQGTGPLRLVLVGRGIREKGWEEAIQAVQHLNRQYAGKLELTLVGEGNFLQQLQASYGADPAIQFAGYQDEVKPYLEAAHLCLLPSYYAGESLPNTIIEALFCGKPVIATTVGAIPEMLDTEDGGTAGILVPLNTDYTVDWLALANAIEVYLINPGQVAEDSAKALKAASKFSMEKCVQAFRTLFENAVAPVAHQP